MTFGELLDDERREGRIEGRIEGRAEGHIEGQKYVFALISAMTADGRGNEISRLAEDADFREEMFARYHITDEVCNAQNA